MKAIKRPIPVDVKFATSSGTLNTLEGPVAYSNGDAILTGVRGERWPMRRDDFSARYQPTDGQPMSNDGAYVKRRMIVEASRLDNPLIIDLPERGGLRGNPGDWLITAPDGDQWIVADEIFAETYELISDDCL